MSAGVTVQVEFLDTLTHTMRTTSMRVGSGTVPNCDLSRSPEVDHAWRELYRRFDENSRKIVEKLDALAAALTKIRDSFVGTDDELASQLGPSGSTQRVAVATSSGSEAAEP